MPDSTLTLSDHQYLRAFRQLFPARLLKRAVAASGRPTRTRKLPLHLLLGMLITWFFKPEHGLPAFARWLLRSHRHSPSEPALYQARGRLGWTPLLWLRQRVLRPLAQPELDPDAFYRGWRLLALDGSTFTVADTPANERSFGRARNQHRAGGYPLARIVALCEVGTHALIDWVARSYRRSEVELARRLLGRVPRGSLLLADRNFHSFELWHTGQRGGYELLIRVQKGPKLPVREVLPDGSYLSEVLPRRGENKRQRALTVRVIRYQWVTDDGEVRQSRLVTSLLDAAAHPAAELVALYHRRWEQELVFAQIKDQLAKRPMHIRAKDPLRVCQEVEALLLGHYLVRWAMLQAARKAGVPAVSLSFRGALRVLEVRLARIPARPAAAKRWWRRWWEELLSEIGRQRLRPRAGRRCPRARKVTRSHWPVKKHQREGTIPRLEVVPAAAQPDP
jgi:hypothetical protein